MDNYQPSAEQRVGKVATSRFEPPNYEKELTRMLADNGYNIDAEQARLALSLNENNIKKAAKFFIAQYGAYDESYGPCEMTLVSLFVQYCHFYELSCIPY